MDSEKKMEMWKMREEMLNAMSDKELRAFIKGYMMGQKTIVKHLAAMGECGCEGESSCNCGGGCGCEEKECGCGKEKCDCKE